MLRLSFWGDFAPCRGFERIVIEREEKVFGDLITAIQDVNLSILNLESPLCGAANPLEKVGPNLRADPRCIRAVAKAGFQVVGLANNHIMDYGAQGLSDTLEAITAAGLMSVGAGCSLAAARRPLNLVVDDKRIAIIAVAEQEFNIATLSQPGCAPLCAIDNLSQIDEARKKADLVFMFVHCGIEFFPLPRPGLRKLCKFLIERGADAILCHHPHVPGAYEFHQGKPIFYSLGNLLFDHPSPPSGWAEGYGVILEYAEGDNLPSSVEILPYTQDLKQEGIVSLGPSAKIAFDERVTRLNQTLSDEKQYRDAWIELTQKQTSDYLLQLYSPFTIPGLGRIGRLLPNWPQTLQKSNVRSKLNLLRCDSHNELLKHILELRNF